MQGMGGDDFFITIEKSLFPLPAFILGNKHLHARHFACMVKYLQDI
jgi:hypothetical protein